MNAYKNKYAKKCINCDNKVEVEQGFIVKKDNKWLTFCSNCLPKDTSAQKQVRKLTEDGKLFVPYEAHNLNLVRSIPGARWNKDEKCWNISLLDCDRKRVLEILKDLSVDIPESLNVITKSEQMEMAEIKGLYPFQVEGVNWLSKQDGAILGDDMGLGKTIQSLMSLPKNWRVIVVCPASLKYNWEKEIKKWRNDYAPLIIKKPKEFRWPKENEIVIVNYESLPDFLVIPKRKLNEEESYDKFLENWKNSLNNTIQGCSNTLAIIDECHRVKNFKSKRSAKVNGLTRLIAKTWGLTGTILENKAEDLYGIISSLNLVKRTFNSLKNFRNLFGASPGRWGGWVYGQPSTQVSEILRRVILRRKREEVLPDLPTKTYTDVVVNNIDNELKSDLDEKFKQWKESEDFNECLPPFEKFSEIREKLARSRIPAMMEFVEDCEEQNTPLVVFSCHLAPLDKLLCRPGWGVISGATKPETRQKITDAFEQGKLNGLAVSIEAGGVGLNFQRAWTCLFVDLNWNPASNLQAEARLLRIGQKKNVQIFRLVSNHPLDKHVFKLLSRKTKLIKESTESKINPIISNPKVISVSEKDLDSIVNAKAINYEEEVCNDENIIPF